MLTARIKIGDGQVQDTRAWGLIYLSSDHRIGAPLKGFEETSYPEQEGVNVSPKTVDDAFDYKVTFFVRGDTLENVNKKIRDFNAALYTKPVDEDVKTFKVVEFYNDYKSHKIVGYPYPLAEATKFWRDPAGLCEDVVVTEFTIKVNKPSLCNFNLS